jgi:hypothetical protein
MSTATILAAALLALPCVPEAGATTSEVRPVGDFQSVEFRGAGHVVVTAGEQVAVTVSADPRQLPAVLTSVRHGVLVIEQKGYRRHSGDADLTVDIHLPSLARLTLQGAVVADVNGLHGGQTVFVMTGASRLTARGAVDRLVTQLQGASRADLTQLVAGQVDLSVNGVAQVALPPRTPLAASRDSVGSLTSAEPMDPRMQSTIGGSRIPR